MNLKKKLVCLATIAAVSITGMGLAGCYGSYALTKKVYKWNGSLGGTFVNSIVHFIMVCILPVYGISTFVDFILLNTIEALTGSNPLAMGETYEEVAEDGTRIAGVMGDDGMMSISIQGADGKTADFKMMRDGNKVRVFDNEGNFIALHSAPAAQ